MRKFRTFHYVLLATLVFIPTLLFYSYKTLTESFADDVEFFQNIHRQNILQKADQIPEDRIMAAWYGTAFMHIADQESGVLIDPFVSYQSLRSVLNDDLLHIDETAIERTWEKVGRFPCTAIFITHTHYDHIIDAAEFAKRCDSPIYGSLSTAHVIKSHGYENVIVVEPYQEISVGNFIVTMVPGKHGVSFIKSLSFLGNVEEPFAVPAPASKYKMGEVFALHLQHKQMSIVHQASAGFTEGMYQGKKADVVFLGIALRPKTGEYLAKIDQLIAPKLVVPIHYDDFIFRYEEFRVLPTVRFREFVTKAQKRYGAEGLSFLKREQPSFVPVVK